MITASMGDCMQMTLYLGLGIFLGSMLAGGNWQIACMEPFFAAIGIWTLYAKKRWFD